MKKERHFTKFLDVIGSTDRIEVEITCPMNNGDFYVCRARVRFRGITKERSIEGLDGISSIVNAFIYSYLNVMKISEEYGIDYDIGVLKVDDILPVPARIYKQFNDLT